MDFLFDAMASVLAFFYGLVPNYAVSIILLTLVVMVVLTPLTLKGTRSMMMMQQLQPEMKKIQSKYKDDRQRLNEELLKFYKENNINPMGGCLPLLAQMPVFFVLYAVLRGLTRRESDMGFTQGWVAGQAASDTGPSQVPDLMLNFDPAYIQPTTDLYQSLSQTNVMDAFGLDLSESASQALSISVVEAIPYFVLIAIVGISGWVQQKQIQGRQTGNQVNPQQQMIMKFMPLMLPIFSFGLPGGLVLYFAVSNLYRVGQQWFISRSIYGIKKGEKPKREAKELVGAGAGGRKGGGDGGSAKAATSKAKGDSKAGAKGSTKGRSTKGSGSGRGGSSSNGRGGQSKRTSTSAKGGQKASGGSAKGGDQGPVLQPRARKRKKS